MISHPFTRFVLAGAANTGLTYIIYLSLNLFIDYLYAYTVAYVAGIIFSYIVSAGWVFRMRFSLVSFILYPLVYVIQYLCAVLLLDFLVETAAMSETLAPALVILCTLPITYFMSKLVLSGGRKKPGMPG